MSDNKPIPPDRNELEKQKLLLDIQKTEKEIGLLDRDIQSYDKRLADEKEKQKSDSRRFRAETIRLVAISLITAATTLLINRLSQKDKTQSEILVEKHKHCQTVVEKVQDNTRSAEERRSLSCSFTPDCGSMSDPAFVHFRSQFEQVCTELTAQLALAKTDSLNTPIVKEISGNVSTSTKAKLDTLEDRLNVLKQTQKVATDSKSKTEISANINAINKQMDSIIDKIPGAPELVTKSKSISEAYTRQTELVNISIEKTKSYNEKKTQEQGYPQSSWFKEGYFLVFDDFKIILGDLQKAGTITVDICHSTTAAPCEKFIGKNVKISTGSPHGFDLGSYHYVIRLDHIGNAGKNFFKPAAYITVEKYKI